MGGVFEVLIAFVEVLFLLASWLFLLVVVPGVIGLYVARLFPLVGRWKGRRR